MRDSVKWFGLGFLMFGMMGIAWNATLEADPADTAIVSEGAQNIRETRQETRKRLHTEHCFGDGFTDSGQGCAGTGSKDNGRHREGSAIVFFEDVEPTTLGDGPGGNSVEDFDPTGGAGSSTLEDGRLWIESDNSNRLKVWDTSAGPAAWEEVHVGSADTAVTLTAADATDDQILAGSNNIVYNGDFGVTGGTGAHGTGLGAPAGFVKIGSTTFNYDDEVTDSDFRWGDGVRVEVINASGSEGMTHLLSNIPGNTTYKVVVRGRGEAADDVCTVDTTGAKTDMTNSAVTGQTWTTLSGTFVTADATIDDVTIRFIGEDSSDICYYSHVAVYQQGDTSTDRDEVSVGGVAMIYITDAVEDTSISGVFSENLFLETSIHIPGPGYVLMVDASISLRSSAVSTMSARLMRDDCAGGGFTDSSNTKTVTGVLSTATRTIQFFDGRPAPNVGGICRYRFEVKEGISGDSRVNAAGRISQIRILRLPVH